jgi:hypothetical protein
MASLATRRCGRQRRRSRRLVGADRDVGEVRQHAPDAHGPHRPEAERPEPGVRGEDVGRAAEDQVDQRLDEHEHGDLGERVAELRREREEGRFHGYHGTTEMRVNERMRVERREEMAGLLVRVVAGCSLRFIAACLLI